MTKSQGKAVRGKKKQYSLSILQIPPLHMIWITSHVTVDVLSQALNLIAMAPLAMRSFFSVAVYQLACCLIPPSHILYHPPYVDLPQIIPHICHFFTHAKFLENNFTPKFAQ